MPSRSRPLTVAPPSPLPPPVWATARAEAFLLSWSNLQLSARASPTSRSISSESPYSIPVYNKASSRNRGVRPGSISCSISRGGVVFRQFRYCNAHACELFGDCLICSNLKRFELFFCSIACCILRFSSSYGETTPRHREKGQYLSKSPVSPSRCPSSSLSMPEMTQNISWLPCSPSMHRAVFQTAQLLSQNPALYHIGPNSPEFGISSEIYLNSLGLSTHKAGNKSTYPYWFVVQVQ